MTDHDSVEAFSSEAGLFSYAQILHLLKIEFSRSRRYGYPLSCCVFQIDRIDHLKDLYGYRVRDRIEEHVVALVHQLSRSSDFLGKVGDRMILILPHTDGEGCRILMSRVKDGLSSFTFDIDGRPVQASLSAGIATYQERNTLFFDAIIRNAEASLEEALRRGGNEIVVHSASPSSPEGANV